jgi:valyl-tRNA synthetase
MELNKNYTPAEIESKWYATWRENNYFSSKPDGREAYTIVIPPPNVTGVLHMGHMLNNTIQDLLIRKARMEGKNACWVPGTDHASIATEAKVVQRLRGMGIKKSDLSREVFLEHAHKWKDQYEAEILGQLQRLGASCDWDRTSFTLDHEYSKDVISVFIDLYNKGFLYRDLKMVNWDPEAKTTLSNEEVIHKEERSRLYFVKYKIENSEEFITIATTRPETILGDTAICIHPKDERYAHLRGKKAIVPLLNRAIPIIEDDYVDIEFGTGCLKVTPAHDINDYELGKKHGLETINMMNDDGTVSEAGILFVGEDRAIVRKKIVKEIEAIGQLNKIEDITNKVGYSERTNCVIEPKLSLQWFVDMPKIVGPALENVLNENIKIYPDRFVNLYKHWLENIRDWPISRQLWWGQRIPAFYNDKGDVAVADSLEKAIAFFKSKNQSTEGVHQDEDVVDTWFSSWLWPISVFDGFKNPEGEIKYYYPTSVLVTGWDIIFFWVARMIIAGYEFKGEMPFKDVYFTGMVRDANRKKMSKSLGNSPDSMELIDKYGADGVRFGLLFCSPAGGDLIFDAPYDAKNKTTENSSALCEQGRNFCNKLWNVLKLIKGLEVYEGKNEENEVVIHWFENKLQSTINQYHHNLDQYRISEALKDLYSFIWDDFCSWYLELIKPEYQKPIDAYTLEKTIGFIEEICKVLHPMMPFITEELWSHIRDRKAGDHCIIASFPAKGDFDQSIIDNTENIKELITGIREVRAKAQMKNSEQAEVEYASKNPIYLAYKEKVKKLAFLSRFEVSNEELGDDVGIIVKGDLFKIHTGKTVNPEEEKVKIAEEMKYYEGFIKSVESKLSNERFVAGAPAAVVDAENRKLADGKAKLAALMEQMKSLG